MKDLVNHAVKLREGFRPFAPACLADQAREWLDLTGLRDSPSMLFIVPVQPDKRAKIPAVTHVEWKRQGPDGDLRAEPALPCGPPGVPCAHRGARGVEHVFQREG